MHPLKKIIITLIGLLFLIPSNAQEKADFGFAISTSQYNKFTLEYRKPFGEKYHFRLAAAYGESNYYLWQQQGEIISVSDSIITKRNYLKNGFRTGLRFGVERQFGNSMFSVGTDLSLNYWQSNSAYQYSSTYLRDDGTWSGNSLFPGFQPSDDPNNSRISRHYVVPGVRLSLNMNIPIGNSFILNLAGSGIFNVPLYMGATQVDDPLGLFNYIPQRWLDFNTNASIGLRYIIGSRNKKRG
ncbi:MAG: hypothetical protein GQ574_01205 [Crocinitomix sp.]|nr:hypothetical protein [Crocinitomix sp.]